MGGLGGVEEDGGVVLSHCRCCGGDVDGGFGFELGGGSDSLWLGLFSLCGALPSWETR